MYNGEHALFCSVLFVCLLFWYDFDWALVSSGPVRVIEAFCGDVHVSIRLEPIRARFNKKRFRKIILIVI